MMHIRIIGIGAGAAAALLFASVTSGDVAVDPAVLSRAAADHDRRARLESLGGADRRAYRRIRAWASCSAPFFCWPSSPAPAFPPGGLAISRCWRAPRPQQRQRSRRDALEWYPPGRLVVWAAILAALVVIVAIPNFGTDAESFRAGLHDALSTHAARRDRHAGRTRR